LGVVGIAVPLLPTTPFLLLASACFASSSERFNRSLHSNRVFGSYLTDYEAGRGISSRAKSATITVLWATILVSAALLSGTHLRLVLFFVAVAVTAHILYIPTNRR
jgi:hypothetical protein